MASAADLFQVGGASLSYGALPVLRGVSFSVRESEIHAVVGEHGAGKTSLALIINGDRSPSSGELFFRGARVEGHNRRKASAMGVQMVYQGIELNESFTLAENLFFGMAKVAASQFRLYNKRKLEELARAYLSGLGFALDPSLPARELTPADQALIAVLRQVYTKPRLLILDEALERLSTANANRVIALLRELVSRGSSIVFITHRIDDIYELADRVSILKDGELLLTEDVKNIDKINLLKIAYTHITNESSLAIGKDEFSQYLKYNEAILTKLPINLIVTDRDHRVKLVNDAARELFAVRETTFMDLPVDMVVPPGNDAVLPMVKSLSPPGEMRAFYNVPLSLPKKKGITNIIVYPIYDGNAPIGNIVIIEDVTEREKMREQMVLSEKLASVGLLAAGVAHEINNPLGTICNYIESLKYVSQGDDRHQQLVFDLEEQVEYIASIVNNLLSFSESNRIPVEKIECNGLIQSIIRLIQHSARSKGIEIRFSAAVPFIELTANRNEVKQVLLNLFKNSFEAMPDGGVVSISTEIVSRDGVPSLRLLFRDSGQGVQFENPNDVFLPFSSTKKEGANLGLGLSIVFSLIRKYDGDISVRNLPEGGCEFTILLPRQGRVPEA